MLNRSRWSNVARKQNNQLCIGFGRKSSIRQMSKTMTLLEKKRR